MQKPKAGLICSFLIGISAITIFSQETKLEKPIECNSKASIRGRFKTLSVGFSGIPFQIKVKVDVKDQTDKNYLAIVEELKAKYCKEEDLRIIMFDSKEHFKLWSTPQPDFRINGTPRALYFINRITKKEIFEVYKIINGRIETRIIYGEGKAQLNIPSFSNTE